MVAMNAGMQSIRHPVILPAALLSAIMLTELLVIMIVNDGHFIFTLDDPYIHLALAENILHGHYGVNLSEYAAPSSSILWPFLIAPLTALPATAFAVLLLNALCSLLSLYFCNAVMNEVGVYRGQAVASRSRFWLLLGFVVIANPVGLAFTGMEHSLQLLLAVIVVWGVTNAVNGKAMPALAWAAVIAAPLVRYEMAALSAAALLFLFIQKQYWQSVVAGIAIASLLGLFSVFLLGLDLGYLPDSVLSKSDVAASGAGKLWHNVQRNFMPPATLKAVGLLLMAVFFAAQAISHKVPVAQRLVSACLLGAVALHMLAGRIGWYFRYEIYIWAAAIIWLAWLYMANNRQIKAAKPLLFLLLAVSVLEHGFAALSTPVAANNIYRQQYQLHRFIQGYAKPVAVNDLGWTSYKNPHYVLDLWGLGSGQARGLRKSGADVEWMDVLVQQHGIKLIMIYQHKIWFESVPDNWIKLGEMSNTGMRLTARLPVSFFTPCASCVQELKQQLGAFSGTLPAHVSLTLEP